jgi:hypothetical protein
MYVQIERKHKGKERIFLCIHFEKFKSQHRGVFINDGEEVGCELGGAPASTFR